MKITKAVQYAYPTSQTAIDLGYPKTGCYFVSLGLDPLNDSAELIAGADTLKDCLEVSALAERLQGVPWFEYCGHIQNGSNFK